MSGLWLVSYIALWVLFLAVAVVLIGVMRNLGVIYESITPAPKQSSPSNLIPGQSLPEVNLLTLAGDIIPISKIGGMKMAISIISPTCSPCQELLERINRGKWQLDPLDPSLENLAIVSIGDANLTNNLIRQVGLRHDIQVLIDPEQQMLKEWGVVSTPTTIIVDNQLKVVRHVIGLGGEAVQPAM